MASGEDLFAQLDLANRADDSLGFDTDLALTDGTVLAFVFDFKIKTTAEGGPTAIKTVQVILTICGAEVLSPVDAAAYEKTLDIGPSASIFDLDVAALFQTDDNYCPPQSYTLKLNTDYASQEDPTADDLLNFNLTDTTLSLYAQDEKEHTFYVLTESITGQFAYKEFTLTVQCVAGS